MNPSIHNYLSHPPKNNRFYSIAIDGRGGSGKTTLLRYMQMLLPHFVFLHGDDYFEPVEGKVVWGSFNDKRFNEEVIKPLKTGRTFTNKQYDWQSHSIVSGSEVTIHEGLCLERCYSFQMDLPWDLKIWVETPPNICLERGVSRERMPKERALSAWRDVWQPEEDTYIRTYKPMQQADLVIDGTMPFESQLVK